MTPSRLAVLALAVLVAAWVPRAFAFPSDYDAYCSSCHGSRADTCHGCHSHGAQKSSPKNAIGIAGQLDKPSYAPGDTITVTVTGGYAPTEFKAGWLRIVLLDDAMAEIGRSGCPGDKGGCVNDYPVTLTAIAPSSGSSHTWAIAWYGNAAGDMTSHSLGLGLSATLRPGYFTKDTGTPNHGWQTVALPSFTVTGAEPVSMGTSPSTTPSGGCGSGSGGLAAVVFLTLVAAWRLRRRLEA